MIVFSPAKINLGLQILRKRPDGYHDISTIMYPVPLLDIIEIQHQEGDVSSFEYSSSGIDVPGDIELNLCYKAWALFNKYQKTGKIRFHLHKQTPHGAGLGGGSSNAARTLKALNDISGNILPLKKLHEMAAELGSDCAFFLYDTPMFAEGRGEILRESEISLKGEYLVLVNPGIRVNTAWAYSQITPDENRPVLSQDQYKLVDEWKMHLKNDFEESVFALHPLIGKIKESLYLAGAIYASMSGSGSSVYGIFREKPVLPEETIKYIIWEGLLS